MSLELVTSNENRKMLPSSGLAQDQSYLICELSGTRIGVEALAVQEITSLPAWTPIAGGPSLVAGVVDVRGQFIPLVDMAVALGLHSLPPQRSDALVLIERDGMMVGIVVQQVREVQTLSPRHFEAAQEETEVSQAASSSEFTIGLASLDNTVVQILNLGPILQPSGHARQAKLSLSGVTPEDAAIYQQRAQILAATAHTTTADETLELAVFEVAGERFGLELMTVREFASLGAVTPVPRAPAYILGLINLRGETLPLVDPRFSMGLPSLQMNAGLKGKAHVVVIESGSIRAGLVVDAVLDVRRAPIAQLKAHAARDDRDPLRATWMVDGELLGILDAARLLAGENAG